MTGLDRRVNIVTVITAVIAAVTLIVVAYSVPIILASNDNTEALREIQDTQECRAEVSGRAARARGEVIRIIAEGIAYQNVDRALLAEATTDLESSSVDLDRINDICTPEAEE